MRINPKYLAKSRLLTKKLLMQNEGKIINPENLMAYDFTSIQMHETSQIVLNGELLLNSSLSEDGGKSTLLKMEENARLEVTGGKFNVFYGGDIAVYKDASLIVGDSFVNNNCRIRCGRKIIIGDGCAISHNVSISDSDFHILIKDGKEQQRIGSGIVIENNVWIGTGATILKDVHIGEGAVIAAGAVVKEDVPAHALVAGNPAVVIDENVEWKG